MTTVKDVQRAQVLIERCMLTYMSFEEVQSKLHRESDVEPALTKVVWRKLQEANPRFFEHYMLRVRFKEQVAAFAKLSAPSGTGALGGSPMQTVRSRELQDDAMAPSPMMSAVNPDSYIG
tara:strand:- start:497 stop:856 length:360 start_codon:yes stop_codon:yes gene_type:complete